MATVKTNNALYNSIKALLIKAKNQIVRNVNITMVLTYYEMGRMIVEDEQKGKYRAAYSKKVLEQLSEQLTKEFGKGYSMSNLEYIRKFYSVYNNRIPQSLIGKSEKSRKTKAVAIPQSLIEEFKTPFVLSWTHYIQLLKIEHDEERNFYEIEADRGNWSVRELQRQFNSSLYERLALSKDKKSVKDLSRKGQITEKPSDTLKHHAVLEFLGLGENERYTESDLENAISNKLGHFMMEILCKVLHNSSYAYRFVM